MKIKHFKRMICFLLAVVVLLSMPLDTTAHAVAVESWVMYALITFMTAMGITFTVAGGVDAMVQAMEEKVDEFQQKGIIIDFYDEMRKGIRLVPKPEPDPSGNEILDLFFTANVVEAINEFLQWLTNDGGWSLGSEQTNSFAYAYTFADQYSNGSLLEDNKVIQMTQSESTGVNGFYNVTQLGDVFTIDEATLQLNNSENAYTNGIVFPYNTSGYTWGTTIVTWNSNKTPSVYFYRNFADWNTWSDYLNWQKQGKTYDNITGIVYKYSSQYSCNLGFLMDDNTVSWTSTTLSSTMFTVEESAEIDIPVEIPLLTPEQKQGVLLNQDFIGSPDLIEWSNWVEEIFTDTGTIPQPTPQVVQDPDYAPEPTPAPTPVPSPEIEDIEDLGLPTLGEALFNKFPFSLPRDLKRIADILNAEPVAPFWEVDLFAPLADDIAFQGDTTLRIDLTEYEVLGQISRWASVIGFCIMLIIITKGVIKW